MDFADDIVLLAHRHQDIQQRTNDVATIGRQTGLNINTDETKLMKINARSDQQDTIDNKNIEVQEFVYLGSKITTDGNSEMDVLHRLSKARGAFAVLNQTKDFQEQCSWSPSIWRRVLKGVTIHMPQDKCIPNKMSQENAQDFLAKNHLQSGGDGLLLQ